MSRLTKQDTFGFEPKESFFSDEYLDKYQSDIIKCKTECNNKCNENPEKTIEKISKKDDSSHWFWGGKRKRKTKHKRNKGKKN